ncbi:MAG: hypothetical protein Q4F34_08330 [Prevotellaceae bacterium]|nr:hypothetical protein [Prevotellaceae bacterium]
MGWIADFWRDEVGAVLTSDNIDGGFDYASITSVEPWGWDEYLRKKLQKLGVNDSSLPTSEEIEVLKNLSSRSQYSSLLSALCKIENTIGEAAYIEKYEELCSFLQQGASKFMMKAPWSSSGRGIRLLDERSLAWARKIIDTQGGIMVEPYYINKVKDFALEFEWKNGTTKYLGLSLFNNSNDGSAYAGNLVASESYKRNLVSHYVNLSLIDAIRDAIIAEMNTRLKDLTIDTPFGVDMMILEDAGQYKVHPCVEVNLRRTMGYVALMVYENIKSGKIKESIKSKTYNYEENFVGYFSVDAFNGKCTIREQGVESGQW